VKQVADTEEVSIKESPRTKDRVRWDRILQLVETESCDRAWGCALYKLNRRGRIDNDEREAGDKYLKLVEDHRRLQETDPEELEYGKELAYKRIRRAQELYTQARKLIGVGAQVLDPLLFDEIWPVGEKEHLIVKQCLTILKTFFASGTKRQHKK
jgi:hypothetical protein